MKMVYSPLATGLPWSSLPSQMTLYLPGGRVGRAIVKTMSFFSTSLRAWSARYQRFRSGSHWNGPAPPMETQSVRLRTGNPSLFSTQMATYGRR